MWERVSYFLFRRRNCHKLCMRCEYFDLCKGETEERAKKGRKMDVAKIFPVILIVLDVGAGVVYACGGDMRKAVYWIAAAVLNVAVTF